MPTYDYECGSCGKTFEVFQSIKEDLLKKCPKCGKLKLQRLFGTGGGVIFKGSGFYTTDYKTRHQKETTEKSATKKVTKRIDKKVETKK